MQDITREPIDIIIKASESAVSQAVDFAIRTDEINKRLIKFMLKLCVIICATFALILIFTAGFYFVGYTNYPNKEDSYVGENQEIPRQNTLQESKTPKIERSVDVGRN